MNRYISNLYIFKWPDNAEKPPEGEIPMDVKTLCLGVLNRGDATGYEIKKQCEEGPFSHFYAAGFGSIYPALNGLAESGLIEAHAQAQEKRPDKKVYRITAAGRTALSDAISKPPARDRFRSDFWFTLFFAPLLEPLRLSELIEERIAALGSHLAAMEGCALRDGPAGERFVHGAGLALIQAELDYLLTHRDEILSEVSRLDAGASTAAE